VSKDARKQFFSYGEVVSKPEKEPDCGGDQQEEPVHDYAGAEEYTTLHRITLWRAVRDGRLKASGYGRAVRFHVEDLEAFMSARNRK
jgi:excisionase family DNA binding protein